jgi:DUF1680 family protein
MYAATGNKQVLEKLNYMIDQLEKRQQKDADGYVCGIPGSKNYQIMTYQFSHIANNRYRPLFQQRTFV